VLFEDSGWRALRPLTDLLPVPALAFGASTLGERWMRSTGLLLSGIVARGDAMRGWAAAPALDPGPREAADEILAVNAAALPGPWVETVLRDESPALFTQGRRIACVRAGYATLAAGFSRAAEFEPFLNDLGLPRRAVEARLIGYPWDLIGWNADAIAEDLAGQPGALRGEVHPQAVVLEPGRVTVEAGARVDPFAVLDGRGGPIQIGREAVVLPHTVVAGPCVVGPGTQLLGGRVARSTIGPQCRIAGEVEECVWQGYANKRHHGFVGHSLIGEWANLGALTTTSDLKNNYGPVRVWVDGREVDSGTPKVGSLIGAHVKTGIGTLLPTGASVGVGSNLFGGGRFAPKLVPAFSWWDGERFDEHRLEPFLDTARVAMSRRGRTMLPAEEKALRSLHQATAEERAGREPLALPRSPSLPSPGRA
jgi:UDP-N-acetylglucosamine diphosphorylase/glucosamine-1-phosphate N-acetyltransferase